MQNTSRTVLTQFAHVLQQELFPRLETALGPLSPQMQLLASVTGWIPLGRVLASRRSRTGRPAKDRAALAIAFIAKAIFNLPTTRDLIDRLRVDEALRCLCGWRAVKTLPHESKFSRVFSEFASTRLPQLLQEAVVDRTQANRLIGHIARDSTAIHARERFAETAEQSQNRRGNKTKSKTRKERFARAKAAERGTRIQRQRHQTVDQMLADLPQQCDIGVKTSSQGHQHYWRGYKLHLDVADGQIPISCYLSSASVHDSQVAIPLMRMTSKRVVYLYDLMDSAYDAESILAESSSLDHVPLVAPHPRRGTKKPSQCPTSFPPTPTPEFTWAQQARYKERTMSERVNARLKDEFGANHIRVRGPVKVMAHLAFGLLALTVDQCLRMI
jgi:transposase